MGLLGEIDWVKVGVGAGIGAVVAYLLRDRFAAQPLEGEAIEYVGPTPAGQLTISPDTPFGQAVVLAARADLGVTEEGGNNRGPRVEQMQANTGNHPGDNWCASAASTWVFEAADALRRPRPIHGSGGVLNLVSQMQDQSNPAVGWIDAAQLRANPSLVRPGMLVMWRRGALGSGLGHVGLVQAGVDASGNFVTIEGNSGSAGDRVAENRRPLSADSLIGMGFFRDPAGIA